ncbi:MAG: hypothetical protein UX87_C0035G0003 [Candidatus Amesbacteria bacterium GW2011_GWA1_47_16]|uniref:ATP synthase gamma chain n=5 Tax=Candidatus Amesiibacteriota TaxID=1752730 RepID=A0A1F4ZTC4_9BACT|nr:MAG: hypothetical protein UX87_C0035G0003 [Candidatus Amesbacteria bacterium GW2011_GWA1_47_16]KKU63316.1 MAG: hypothetical protein UX86_C0027G0006 [Candidatus Amesbacteria bacterium GW2011_GWC1_47_15]KKU96436.1 MAG: hypothetical protein UY28_C0034G0002 [Candidatus Amesbacteria bacterium GW2011_GWB1_48_13]OGC99983.1 MAG: hypothetical protein A2701_00880 [Candidatus Amesbacteria bacterium RIFCSPHIGHO2_01_FULL_47_34]OGD01164.1 MAG: hypothetical protein A2972_05140 [Candidatus Amesbacteria bact
MITKKQISIETESLFSLKGLVEVYEEVAAGRMQKVRGAVLQSRKFQEGLLDVFRKVKTVYRRHPEQGALKRRGNGQQVAVFVSANAGLYGDIVDKTFEMFVQHVQKNKSEVVVLGKLGIKMMADRLSGTLYNYYDFSDDEVDSESFEMIMRYLIQFEKILVFYGQFKTILSQEPVTTVVSGDLLEEQMQTEEKKEHKTRVIYDDYLFEPSVSVVAQTFEGEILASMFEQTLHESQLAKFASRLMALDRAVDNIDGRMLVMKREARKLMHKTYNSKQLSKLAGLSLWTYDK